MIVNAALLREWAREHRAAAAEHQRKAEESLRKAAWCERDADELESGSEPRRQAPLGTSREG